MLLMYLKRTLHGCPSQLNLVLSNSQITSDYELIWYGRPNANKSSIMDINKTSRWHADIWSHPGHYRVAPYTSSWSPKGHGHGHEWPPVVQCQLTLLFLRYDCFKIWPWKFKVKGIAKVKPDVCICCLEFNRYVCLSFHGNRTIFGWDMTNFIFDDENLAMAKVKSHCHV